MGQTTITGMTPEQAAIFADYELLQRHSTGAKLDLAARLLADVSHELGDENAYQNFAEYTHPHNAVDWGSSLAQQASHEDQSPTPEPTKLVPPANPFDALPGMVNLEIQIQRAHTVIQTQLTNFTLQAYENASDKQEKLGETGFRNAKEHLSVLSQQPTREINRQIKRTQYFLGSVPGRLGVEPAKLPVVGKAFTTGKAPVANIDQVMKLHDDLHRYVNQTSADPAQLLQVLETVEPELAKHAADLSAHEFAGLCRAWFQRISQWLDPDGPEPTEEGPNVHCSARVKVSRDKKIVDLHLRTTGIGAEILQSMVEAATNYSVAVAPVTKIFNGSIPDGRKQAHIRLLGEQPSGTVAMTMDGKKLTATEADRYDPRSREEILHDLFISVFSTALAVKNSPVPASIGAPTRIHLFLDHETFHQAKTGTQQGRLPLEAPKPGRKDAQPVDLSILNQMYPPDGRANNNSRANNNPVYHSESLHLGRLRTHTMEPWLCDAEICRVVVDVNSQVLDYGTARRTFSGAQRQAAMANYRCCAFPGCTMPLAWCQAHHIEYWENGGATDLANQVPLCVGHHSTIHHQNWNIEIDEDGTWFVPPPSIDPRQPKLRNLAGSY